MKTCLQLAMVVIQFAIMAQLGSLVARSQTSKNPKFKVFEIKTVNLGI